MPISSRTNGQTIDETWFNILKTEIEALQASRLLLVTGLSIPFEVMGNYSKQLNLDAVMYYLVTQDITITAATLKIITAGSSGALDVDIKRKRGGGSWVSLFTTRPAVPYTAGSFADSDSGAGATAAVVDSVTETVLAGDLLRLDILSVQTNGIGFNVSLEYEPTGVV
jgi:hypothetical protein